MNRYGISPNEPGSVRLAERQAGFRTTLEGEWRKQGVSSNRIFTWLEAGLVRLDTIFSWHRAKGVQTINIGKRNIGQRNIGRNRMFGQK